MFSSQVRVKKRLEDAGCLAVDVFTSSKTETFQRTLILLLTCSFFSLLLSTLLLLYLLYSLDYQPAAAGGVSGCFGTILTVTLFFSKRVRCLGTLFVISVFMKKSRSLLLTAGTSLVVVRNMRNTLENLTGLLRSVVCNLKAKKAAIADPFRNYVKILKWIGNMLKGITDLGLVNLEHQLKVSPRLESEKFRERLSEAEQKLNETVKYAQSLVSAVSSVTDKLFPAISFLLLVLFIALHVKKYRRDLKYQNRFISGTLVTFDEKQKAEGKPHVLPLTPEERKEFRSITSLHPTARERKAALKFAVSVLVHSLAWVIFITVDALLYCFVTIVTTKLSELEPFHVPLIMSIKDVTTLIGIPISEERNQQDFSYSVTLFEEKCLPKPKLLLYQSIVPLTLILILLLVMTAMAGNMLQLRLMVCERFFSGAAEERAQYLHAKILQRRLKTKKQGSDSGLRPLVRKLHFWFPLLFRPKDDPQDIV